MTLTQHDYLLIFAAASVTFSIRALPWTGLVPQSWIQKIKDVQDLLPILFLTLLVFYCFSDSFSKASQENVPLFLSCALIVILQWWVRNSLLSLSLGSAAYLLWVNF